MDIQPGSVEPAAVGTSEGGCRGTLARPLTTAANPVLIGAPAPAQTHRQSLKGMSGRLALPPPFPDWDPIAGGWPGERMPHISRAHGTTKCTPVGSLLRACDAPSESTGTLTRRLAPMCMGEGSGEPRISCLGDPMMASGRGSFLSAARGARMTRPAVMGTWKTAS